MKVVCIDAIYSEGDLDKSDGSRKFIWSPEMLSGTKRLKYRSSILTKGKVYDINDRWQPADKGVYFLIGDGGIQLYCTANRFLTIEEYRQNQLNDILE